MKVENFIKFYQSKKNKERLLRLLKKHGNYKGFSETYGYIYSVKIGEVEKSELLLEVAIKMNNFKILNVYKGEKLLNSAAVGE